jgi:hypothetical protein
MNADETFKNIIAKAWGKTNEISRPRMSPEAGSVDSENSLPETPSPLRGRERK